MRYRLCLIGLLCFPTLAMAKGLLVLGDSISAAYGLEKEQGWVALLADELDAQCDEFPVINASVSGETTAGGRKRLPALLEKHEPERVIIELGGNDGLRGLSPLAMASNLQAMISASRQAGASPLLLGMRIPPNYGQQYTALFETQFADTAEKTGVPFMPFFLDGVVEAGQLQDDGIHPTAEAQPRLKNHAMDLLKSHLPERC